jgi:hypothetical protein
MARPATLLVDADLLVAFGAAAMAVPLYLLGPWSQTHFDFSHPN